MTRLFDPRHIVIGESMRLSDTASHHMMTVLRAKLGDHLTLFNGQGGEYQAYITAIHKKGVTVLVRAFADQECESPLPIYLAQSITRADKMDYIVQKAVELGVYRIMPIIAARSQGRLSKERERTRLAHWQAIALAACEQCGRNRVPDMDFPILLEEWLPTAHAEYRYILSPNAGASHGLNQRPLSRHPISVMLLIGPEGGFSEAEMHLSIACGFTPLSLGPRILRTETASLAAISIVQSLYGDLLTF